MASTRVSVVTGASAGIGLAVSEKLRARGDRVVMVARGREVLEREAARIGGEPWVLDVGDLAAAAAFPAQVVARFGSLDVLINNAGAHSRGPFLEVSPEQIAQMITVNLTAPLVLCRAAIPLMPAGGSIVNVASVAGYAPLPGSTTYSSTKVGLRYATRALALEHPQLHISAVSPGPVDTGFFGDELDRVTDITVSQPMVTAEAVADEVLGVLDQSTEVAIPASSGRLATLGYLMPWLYTALRPSLMRKGAKKKAAYKALVASRKQVRG